MNSLANFLTTILTSFTAVGLALVHLYCGKLRFFEAIPRSRWLSFAGGASVAYVFVHLLPELNAIQQTFEQTNTIQLELEQHYVYLMALVGLIVFYGLEKFALSSRKQKQAQENIDHTHESVFQVHIASFALYNALIGYLLVHREETGLVSLLAFFIAITLHFFVNDSSLRSHHKHQYDRFGRWILAIAIMLGWAVGQATAISEFLLAALFAFVGGSIILNVIKEELPEERQSRFWWFFGGAMLYSSLLLLI